MAQLDIYLRNTVLTHLREGSSRPTYIAARRDPRFAIHDRRAGGESGRPWGREPGVWGGHRRQGGRADRECRVDGPDHSGCAVGYVLCGDLAQTTAILYERSETVEGEFGEFCFGVQ